MSYAAQSSSYREMEIQSASPHKLVVIVFEQLVINLERARIAMERNDINLRVTSVRRARDLVFELLGTLNIEAGGPLAVELAGHYQVMLYELMDLGIRNDVKTIGKLINIATPLRDGFVGAAEQLAREGARAKVALKSA
jgi:flagellar secretion chaperone FliS